jgi:hypothetical protein
MIMLQAKPLLNRIIQTDGVFGTAGPLKDWL